MTTTPSTDAWHAFCDRLKQAGEQLLRSEVPQSDLIRAEGYRYLSRLLRAGIESQLEFADPARPGFYSLSNETIKIGGDNPDNLYANATISGAHEYRIVGRRGSVHYLSFATKAGGFGSDGSLRGIGAIDSRSMQFDADGGFEIRIGGQQRPGNWLPTSDDTRMLLVRQTFLDRASEIPAEFSIECLDAPAAAPPSAAQMAQRLMASADFVVGTARVFADWTQDFQATPNRFIEQDQSRYQRSGGDPAIFYSHGYWRLAPDEVLLVHVAPLDCEFWNFQVDNYWMESLDYRYHRIHLNRHDARYEADGSAVLAIAARDPGMPNWLQTVGHTEGTMLFRAVRAEHPAYPRTEIVRLQDLPGRSRGR